MRPGVMRIILALGRAFGKDRRVCSTRLLALAMAARASRQRLALCGAQGRHSDRLKLLAHLLKFTKDGAHILLKLGLGHVPRRCSHVIVGAKCQRDRKNVLPVDRRKYFRQVAPEDARVAAGVAPVDHVGRRAVRVVALQ
eukprot:scaffold248673_cov37-Tisochrysis_lutea.AAC.2